MKIFSREAIASLESFVPIFKSAIESNYARNLGNRAMEGLRDLYDRENGTVTKMDFGCPHCCLTFIKNVGRQYFESIEYYKAKDTMVVERMAKAREAKKNNSNK